MKLKAFSLVFLLTLLVASPLIGGELKIHVINVTKGEATFIEFPDGTTWLIDMGLSGTSGNRVHDYICGLGYSSLDYVVATHFDQDHYGGIDEVLSGGSPALSYTTAAYEHEGPKIGGDDSLTAIWDAETTSPMRSSPSPGQTWSFGGVTVECVCVGHVDINESNGYNTLLDSTQVSLGAEENNYSLGFRISWEGFDYLTLGDLADDVEDVLAPKIAANIFDVLHVSHHGSSTSSSLYSCETLQPEVAVISVGSSNTYGHPTQDVINNLNGSGSSWVGVDRTYVTEEGYYGIEGDAANVNYLSDDIVITFNSLTGKYTVQGGGRNDEYDADELVDQFPMQFNFQPEEGITPTGFNADTGQSYAENGVYGWSPEEGPEDQIAFTGFENPQASDPIGYTIDTSQCDLQTGDYFERQTFSPVRTGSYEFHTRDLNGNAFLEFDSIDVSSYSSVVVHLWFTCSDTDYEATDYAKAWVEVDSVTQPNFMDLGELGLEGHSTSYVEYTYNVPAGANSIKIWFEAMNNSDLERCYLDDVEVTGVSN